MGLHGVFSLKHNLQIFVFPQVAHLRETCSQVHCVWCARPEASPTKRLAHTALAHFVATAMSNIVVRLSFVICSCPISLMISSPSAVSPQGSLPLTSTAFQ